MVKNKNVFVYITGLDCEIRFKNHYADDNTILEKVHETIEELKVQKDKVFWFNKHMYTLDNLNKLNDILSDIKINKLKYDINILLDNNYLNNLFNELYLLYLTQSYKKIYKYTIVHIICDKDAFNQKSNIFKYFCNIDKHSNLKNVDIDKNKYFKDTLNCILKYVRNPEYAQVILEGYSYGGGITSKISTYLNTMLDEKEAKKIQIATIGSIYIPSPHRTDNLKIYHYVYQNDPAFRCTRLQDYSKYNNVSIMNAPRESFRPDENILDIHLFKKNWESHTMFDHITASILKNKNTRVKVHNII